MRVLFLLAFVLLPAHADLYRWIDPDTGSVRLSSLPPSDSSVDAEVVPFKAAATLPPAVARPGAVATARETLQARWSDLLRQLTGMSQQDFNRAGAGVRQQITQGLTNQRKAILNAALLETAINEARIVNHLASNMLNNPGNLGLRPAAAGSAPTQAPSQAPSQAPAASPAASSSTSVKPASSPK